MPPDPVRDVYEPGAVEWDDQLDALFRDPDAPPYVRSAASRELLAEMRRYAGRRSAEPQFRRQTIPGRSVLLSGQRGSGKTATVQWVIRELNYELRRNREAVRVLYVPIQSSSWAGDRKKSRGQNEHDLGQAVLRELLFALHRAVIRECLRSLRIRIQTIAGRQPDPLHAETTLHELLAQLRVEFENHIKPRHLRDLWSRLRFLDPDSWGTAFFNRSEVGRAAVTPASNREATKKEQESSTEASEEARQAKPRLPLDQGACELNVLTKLNEVYLRLVGTLSEQEPDSVNTAELKTALNQFVESPIARQLLGALVGGGVASAGASGLGATAQMFFGLAGAIGTGVLLSWIGLEHLGMPHKPNRTFSRELSAESLDRDIDRIIDDLLNAGLAPVFVFDELDKLHEPEKVIRKLEQNLKQFFAERAFVCFLTHRQFFDAVRQCEQQRSTTVESTWFGRVGFIEYEARDIRKYARARINAIFANLPVQFAQKEEEESDSIDQVRQALRRDAVIWEYVLAFRAGPSMGHLHQELLELSRLCETQRYRPGMVYDTNRPLWRLEALLQFIIEVEARSYWNTATIGQEPGELHLLQLLCRQLRQSWLDGKSVQLGEKGMVEWRMRLTELTGDDVALENRRRPLDLGEVQRLWPKLEEFLKLLVRILIREELDINRLDSEQLQLHDEILQDGILESIQHVLPLLKPSDVPPEANFGPAYDWSYSRDGMGGRNARQVEAEVVAGPLEKARGTILKWQHILNAPGRSLSAVDGIEWVDGAVDFGRLADHGLVGRIPSVTRVRDALQLLESDDLTDSDRYNAEVDIRRFAAMLNERAELIAICLQLSGVLGRIRPELSPINRTSSGLRAIEKWLSLGRQDKPGQRLREHMQACLCIPDVMLQFRSVNQADHRRLDVGTFSMHPDEIAEKTSVDLMQLSAEPLRKDVVEEFLPDLQWKCWDWFFQNIHRTRIRRADPDVQAAQLICEVAELPGSVLTRPDLTKMNICFLSRIVWKVLETTEEPLLRRVPIRAGLAAMHHLGVFDGLFWLYQPLESLLASQESAYEFSMPGSTVDALSPVEFTRSAETKRTRVSVILIHPEHRDGGLAQLIPSANCHCIAIEQGQDKAIEAHLERLREHVEIANLFIEEPNPEEDVGELIHPLRSLIHPSTRVIGVFKDVPPSHVFDWVMTRPVAMKDLLAKFS